MTTFQAIIYGALHGLTGILPLSPEGHDILLSYFLQWPEIPQGLGGAFSLAAGLAILIFFRHDWASLISSLLQVIIFRRKPMMLDERLPGFLIVSAIPVALVWYYGHEAIAAWSPPILMVALFYICFGILLAMADYFNRKTKAMCDWNLSNATGVGIGLLAIFVPGGGLLSGALLLGLFHGYRSESAAKYALLSSLPIFFAQSWLQIRGEIDFHSAAPLPSLSWVTYYVSFLVAFLTSLLAVGTLMKQIQQKGVRSYVAYRIFLGIGAAVTFWVRNRG